MCVDRACSFLTEAEIFELTNCTPKQLGLETVEVPDDTGGKVKGVPFTDPSQSYRRLVCRGALEDERGEYYVTQSKQLRKSQGRDFLSWVKSDVMDPQRPKAARRSTAPPLPLDALKERGVAYLQSMPKPTPLVILKDEDADDSSASEAELERAGLASQLTANNVAVNKGTRGGRGAAW